MHPMHVAFVGLGRWADVLAEATTRTDQLTIVNSYSRSAERRVEFARRFGCATVDRYEDLLTDRNVEALVITVPNEAHVEYVQSAAAAGKHIFIEKPIATTLEGGRQIVEAVQRAGVHFMVGHSARFLAGNRRLKQLIDSGELGDIVMVEANISNDRAMRLQPSEWRFYSRGSPGGPLIQIAVHQFDALYYLLGPVRRLSAFTNRLYTQAEIPDVAQVICEMQSGPLAYIGTSWDSPATYSTHVFGTRGNAHFELDFQFWAQSHRLDAHTRMTVHKAGSAEPVAVTFSASDMFRDELEEFCRAVHEKRPPEVTAAAALHSLAMCEAAIESARSGAAVHVDSLIRGRAS